MEKTSYSFLKGVGKSLQSAAIWIIPIVALIISTVSPDVYNTSIVDLISQYASKIFGTMTLGGFIAFGVNWLKNR